MRIHPRDLATSGSLVLNGGRHEGKQLLLRSWIDAMTAVHTDIPDRPQQYGHLWWIERVRSAQLSPGRVWMAWGNGGNFLVLFSGTVPSQCFRVLDSIDPTRLNHSYGCTIAFYRSWSMHLEDRATARKARRHGQGLDMQLLQHLG